MFPKKISISEVVWSFEKLRNQTTKVIKNI